MSSDMDRHFAEVSSVYREVRTTDREPIERIAMELKGLPHPKGADIGCGAGRYDRLMFEIIPGLHLTCIDANPAMLEQVHGLLAGSGFDAFETRQSTVEGLVLEAGAYDFVTSLNAVHHFDVPDFLRKSRDGLVAGGCLFVYTRLPGQNARSIWGRYFPGFAEKETRLLELGDLHRWIEDTPGLRFVSATCLRYRRRSSPERLVEQARHRHYSTFEFYDQDAFEEALTVFLKKVRRRFPDTVEWHDENVLVHVLRNDD
ncbi:MAG: class I SAM-dependent methyltransferase [Hyphomicrobiales bacterium]|nr:class I SAM-dependent methyltransferase [Hyphomicrobiales bacterium]